MNTPRLRDLIEAVAAASAALEKLHRLIAAAESVAAPDALLLESLAEGAERVWIEAVAKESEDWTPAPIRPEDI